MPAPSQYARISDLQALGLPAKALNNVPIATQTEALQAASALADGYLQSRFTLPLVTWAADLTRAVCAVAAEDLLITRGFDPAAGADGIIATRAARALDWFGDVSKGLVTPLVKDSAVPTPNTPNAPQVRSNRSRGWEGSDGRSSHDR